MKELGGGVGWAGLNKGRGRAGIRRRGAVAEGVVGGGGALVRGERTRNSWRARLQQRGTELKKEQE